MSKNDTLKGIGLKLRAAREAAGLSQEGLAEKAGLDRTYIGGVERGERNISILSLKKIANALDLSLKAVFDDD
ncbi:helix-turn-helix domain-containing protein [Qipengyuania mesophila]|uniref:helix-turn-helix domain-containing protein n=1 Tax=Erythrobacteraceae TaxID=335929 RepID=UPI003512922E